MAQTAEEIVVAANGKVWTAPSDEAALDLPDDVVTALGAAWMEVGFVSEDGVTFTDGRTIEDVLAWQSFYPVRRLVSAKTSTFAFVMRQWDTATVSLAFGGGTVDVSGGGDMIYTPPSPEVIDTRALCVEWQDGDRNFRMVSPRGIVTGDVTANLVRTAAADLPIEYSVTPFGAAGSGDDPLIENAWYLLTDDTDAFTASGS